MQITSNFNFSDKVSFIDGFAILLSVLYHTLTHNLGTSGAEFLLKYISTVGLTLFTFSAGMKIGINHYRELEGTELLKKLYWLYKPYLGCTALIFTPVYFEMYVAKYYFNSKYVGVSQFR